MTMRILRSPCLAGILAACFAGCNDPAPEPLGARVDRFVPDSSSTVVQQGLSGYASAARLLIADSATWQAVWNKVVATVTPAPPLPSMAFSQSLLVLAALGGRPSSGYGITIDSVVRFELGTRVYLTTTSPGAHCGTLSVVTAPVHIVRVDVPIDVPEFEERAVIHDC